MRSSAFTPLYPPDIAVTGLLNASGRPRPSPRRGTSSASLARSRVADAPSSTVQHPGTGHLISHAAGHPRGNGEDHRRRNRHRDPRPPPTRVRSRCFPDRGRATRYPTASTEKGQPASLLRGRHHHGSGRPTRRTTSRRQPGDQVNVISWLDERFAGHDAPALLKPMTPEAMGPAWTGLRWTIDAVDRARDEGDG